MKKIPEFEACFAELISLPSVSSIDPRHDQSNRSIIDALANYLDALGFQCDISVVSHHPEKCNLVATRGTGEDALVFSGHTDTVPYDEEGWHSDPFQLTQRNGHYYGLGTADMKCFFPILFESLHRFGSRQLKRPVVVIASADEESTMAGARALRQANRPLGRYCMIGEPTSLIPKRMHKGILIETIHLIGKSGHSSNPDLGHSALEGMNDVMNALRIWRAALQEKHTHKAFNIPVPTLNFGRIHGGDSPNRICAHCDLTIDLRMLPGMDIDQLRQDMHRVVTNALFNHQLQVKYGAMFEGTPAMMTPKDSDIIRISERLTNTVSGSVAFATEGAYFNEMGMETVILGPGDIEVAHQPNEYLPIKRIEPMVNIITNTLNYFCGV